jgi:hypothetical protein
VLDDDTGVPAGEHLDELAGQTLTEVHIADVDVAQPLGPLLEDLEPAHVRAGRSGFLVEGRGIAGILAVAHGELLDEGVVAELERVREVLPDLGLVLAARGALGLAHEVMSFRGG